MLLVIQNGGEKMQWKRTQTPRVFDSRTCVQLSIVYRRVSVCVRLYMQYLWGTSCGSTCQMHLLYLPADFQICTFIWKLLPTSDILGLAPINLATSSKRTFVRCLISGYCQEPVPYLLQVDYRSQINALSSAAILKLGVLPNAPTMQSPAQEAIVIHVFKVALSWASSRSFIIPPHRKHRPFSI